MENKTIEEVRKNLEESGDVHLQAIARLDHDRLVKLADWIRSLDKE
jgi:predicted RNase H-like HicB family nuclease